MKTDVQVSRKKALLCVILCVIFTALTTYQCCFYILFEQYRKDLSDRTDDFLAQVEAMDVENAALEEEILALTETVDALTERLCELTGAPDGTAEDCLRLLLKEALIQEAGNMNATDDSKIEAQVDAYMDEHASDYIDVAARLLYIDYLYQQNYCEKGPATGTIKDAITRGYIEAAGDLYASYYTPEEYEAFLDRLRAKVTGVGVASAYLAETNEIMVLHPHAGGPAYAAGIRKYDCIYAVNGERFTSESEATAAIAGEAGTSVTLSVRRGEDTFDVTLTRAEVTADTVISTLYEEGTKKIGYIRIVSFAATTAEQFAKDYSALQEAGAEALVLDLRDNGGGQLNTLIDLLNYILPKDTPLLSYAYRNEANAREDVYAKDDGQEIDLPIYLLQNRNTASAGELLASVLRKAGRATLIGERSFGKGTMQTGYLFSDGAYISVSVAVLSPIGAPSHHGSGITPDVYAPVSEMYEETSIYVLPFDEDVPLTKAIELVTNE